MFGGLRATSALSSLSFVSQAFMQNGGEKTLRELGVTRPLAACRHTRHIGKKDMVHNRAMPKLEVNPQTYEVRADGDLLSCPPAAVLPMAQRYFLF